MANWHPIINALEGPVGTKTIIGPLDKPYEVVPTVRHGTEVGNKVVTPRDSDLEPKVVGYFRTLRAAGKAPHSWFTSTSWPTGIPAAGWLPAAGVEARIRNRSN